MSAIKETIKYIEESEWQVSLFELIPNFGHTNFFDGKSEKVVKKFSDYFGVSEKKARKFLSRYLHDSNDTKYGNKKLLAALKEMSQ